MPRKGHTQKRDVLADPIYNNKVVTKLINNIMLDGKKGVAQKIVYGAFDRVAETTGKDAMEVFEEAMNNIMPVLEVKAKRIGGATYQVPIEVRPERRQTLALRWITLYSRKRGEKTQKDRLANEIMDAANNTGASVKKKEDMHKWQRQTRHFHISASNLWNVFNLFDYLRRKIPWLEENIHWREPGISESWPISMLVRQQRQSVSFITLV